MPLRSRPGPRRAPRTLLPAFLAALTAACTGDAPGPGAGVDHWTLGEPDLRFGSLDDPSSTLVPVGDLALGPDGTVWVAQGQDGEILAVGPDGVPHLRIGGRGEGPGEFSAVSRLGWLGDTLWVGDDRNRRISFFGPGGAPRGTIPRPAAQVADSLQAAFTALVPDGALFVVGPGTALLTAPEAPTGGDDPVVVTPRSGGMPRTVAVRSGTRTRSILVAGSGGDIVAVSIVEQPWADGSLVTTPVGGNGVIVVDRAIEAGGEAPGYAVTRLDLDGDTLWSVRRGYDPVSVDPARRDSLILRYAQGPFDVDAVRDALFLPATEPPVTAVFAGRDGRIWVARERAVDAAEWRWDVFAADGGLQATVSTAARVDLHAADERVVWGVETDAFDVPYLVRFTLPGG